MFTVLVTIAILVIRNNYCSYNYNSNHNNNYDYNNYNNNNNNKETIRNFTVQF